MSDEQYGMDPAERAFDAKIHIGWLFQPLTGAQKFPPKAVMRANVLANHCGNPHSILENPLASITNFRRLAAQWRADFRRKRKPLPHARADRIAFAHAPELANELVELVDETEAICRLERDGEEGGRQGISLALLLSARLLERVPGPMAPLVAELDWLRMRLEALDEGDLHQVLSPSKRPQNRPRQNARKRELKLRCVLALHALLACETNPTPGRRLRLCERVYKRARSVAQDVRGEEQCEYAFSARMIDNWYDDRKTARPRSNISGPEDSDEVQVNAQAFAQLDNELAQASDRPAMKAIGDRYLATLDRDNFDRPLHAASPRHWPPFDGW